MGWLLLSKYQNQARIWYLAPTRVLVQEGTLKQWKEEFLLLGDALVS